MIRSMLLIITAVFVCFGQVSTQGLIAWYPFTNGITNEAPGSTLQLSYVSASSQVPAFTKAFSRFSDSSAMKVVNTNGLYGDAAPLPNGNSNRTISAWIYFDGANLNIFPLNLVNMGQAPLVRYAGWV